MNFLLLAWKYKNIIGIALAVITLSGVFVYVKHAMDERYDLKQKVIAMENQHKTDLEYIEKLATDNKALQTGKDNAKKQIQKTRSGMVTPKPLLDTINGLSVD